MKKRWLSIAALSTTVVFLALGMVRASTANFEQKRSALLQACDADQKRLKAADRVSLFGKYGTPEITFWPMVRILPGETGEVVIRGKFPPGAKFVYDNDLISVAKENATATEYHATVNVGQTSGPSISMVYIYTPVSCAFAATPIIYVGGKYEWDLTAANGWHIKMHTLDEQFAATATNTPRPKYSVEFYKGGETKAFQTMEVALDLLSSAQNETYFGPLAAPKPSSGASTGGNPGVEMQTIMQKISDPNLSPAERQKLAQRLKELSMEASNQMSNATANAQKAMQQEAEFGCKSIGLHLSGSAVDGQVNCGPKVGHPKLTGSVSLSGQ